jgi:3D (Asp-Asp-Asp) domain-containing protein
METLILKNYLKGAIKSLVCAAVMLFPTGCANKETKGFGCWIAKTAKNAKVKTAGWARLTVYWKNGSGTDKWTKRGLTSTGKPLVNKKTCAVDPKVIPYHSTVKIPELGLELKSVDTGRDVISKRAALKFGKNLPVIDLYFQNKKDALHFAANNPLFVRYEVF